ncbi:hypothetical protein HWI79_2670, partial [Cryptosporidium felis]
MGYEASVKDQDLMPLRVFSFK